MGFLIALGMDSTVQMSKNNSAVASRLLIIVMANLALNHAVPLYRNSLQQLLRLN